MKKNCLIASILLAVSLTFSGCGANAASSSETAAESAAETTSVEVPTIEKKGTVVVLATGGTIAGSGETGKETNYDPGTITGEDLINSVDGLADVANIQVVQVCNLNSDDITSKEWITLAKTINEMAEDENVDGFVITHGTDTMEETAYFLNLTVKTEKPVVITGAMRPATSLSADGPMNLYQSVCLAESEEARGQGVMAVFSDHIYSARDLTKTSTYAADAISSDETGCIGIMRNETPYFYQNTTKKHTVDTEFDVTDMDSLPKVNVVYFNVDADTEILKAAAEVSDGLVIAGAGAGEFSEEFIDVINSLTIPVVISSRIDNGIITQDSVLCENTVAANNLPPQKAAVLLRLALANGTTDFDSLVRIYSEY